MWIAVMAGDSKAQKRMAKYCAGDVDLTEQVYERVRAYVPNHPHMGMTPALACGACGSNQVQSRGVRRTKASFIQRMQCQRCGSWQSGKRVVSA
jgi:ketopantoate hydroxymethyltransferase